VWVVSCTLPPSLPAGASKRAGPLRNLQEELLAERAESVVLVDRTGSVIGAPTMTFKQPTPQVRSLQGSSFGASLGPRQQHGAFCGEIFGLGPLAVVTL
jgi:hypothetical protein